MSTNYSFNCTRSGAMARRWKSVLIAMLAVVPLSANAAPADFDTRFGTNGVIGATNTGFVFETANAVARQSNASLVIVGGCFDSASSVERFCVRRILPYGGVDFNFGGDGTGIVRIGFLLPNAGESATSVAVQPDGKIVVGGACNADTSGQRLRRRFCVTRLLPDGSIDSASFGTLGRWSAQLMPTGSGSDEILSTVLLQPDGKVLVVGSCTVFSGSPDQSFICHQRLTNSGQLDGTYVPTAIADESTASKPAVLQSDGKIVLGGECRDPVSLGVQGCLTRLTAGGALDSQTFGSNGQSVSVEADGAVFTTGSLAIQGSGELILAGTCSTISANTNHIFCLRRWHANGTIDAAFPAASTMVLANAVHQFVSAMAVQSDGKIIVAGTCLLNGFQSTICLTRFGVDGARDSAFAGGTVPISRDNDYAPQTVVQPDGTIVLAATCGSIPFSQTNSGNVCAAQLIGGPTDFSSCSGDVDGDGEITANDSLLFARVALGFTQTSVTQNVTFATQATRKTWPLIRDYLANHCGLRAGAG